MTPDDEATLSALLAELGMVVLERRDRTWLPLTRPPEWFVRVFAAEALTDNSIATRSPFLEAFLATAAPFWDGGQTGRLRSGPWIETDSAGQDHRCEATAFCLAAKQLLLLESTDRELEASQVLQKARETSLANEALTKQLRTCETGKRSVAFDLAEACRGIEKFIDAVNPGELATKELQYREIGRRQVQRLKALIRELEGTPDAAGETGGR